MSKKCFKCVGYFFIWLLYYAITINERSRYMMAKSRGMDCVHSENDIFGTTFYFDRNSKPERRFATWKEFWIAHGFYQSKKPNKQ